MSLVGPRPCLAYETEYFEPHQFERFLVPAGHDRALAGDGAGTVDVRRGARHGRRVCPRLVARARPPAALLRTPVQLLRRRDGERGIEPDSLRVAVVGLGYWGPNLVRNLVDLPEAEVACDLRRAAGALEAFAAAIRPSRRTTSSTRSSPTRRSTRSDRHAGRHALRSRARRARAGKHVFVEKPLAASLERGARADRARRGARARADAGPHVPLQPARQLMKELIDVGRARRHLLHLDQPREPGLHQPDASVVWDLGPHDFSILRYWLGETPATSRR